MPESKEEAIGQITRLYADVATVQLDGETVQAAIRGRLFRDNPPAVGDFVRLERKAGTHAITGIEPRRSELARRAAGTEEYKVPRKQVLIANIDQVMVVFATAQPEPHRAMLDRFLVVAEANELEAHVVVNKLDLQREVLDELFAPYRQVGYPVHGTSVKTGEGLEALRDALDGKVSVFIGPSGVGKSSLLNALYPGLDLKVGQVSEAYGKGRHTTVGGYLIHLPDGASVADTAGLREIGLWSIPPDELPLCFPEFEPYLAGCRFNDCRHLQEPGCAITEAVEQGKIFDWRYDSYVKLREGAEAAWPRW